MMSVGRLVNVVFDPDPRPRVVAPQFPPPFWTSGSHHR